MKLDIHEFNWVEMFTDSKGRTSPSKVVGFFACVIALMVFFIAAMDAIFIATSENSNLALTTLTVQSLALFTAGGTLLGIRRFTKDKEVEPEQLTNAEKQEFQIQ